MKDENWNVYHVCKLVQDVFLMSLFLKGITESDMDFCICYIMSGSHLFTRHLKNSTYPQMVIW